MQSQHLRQSPNQEAEALWKRFYARNHLNLPTQEAKEAVYRQEEVADQKNDLIDVEIKDDGSPFTRELLYFINGQRIKKSNNLAKINDLKAAFKKGDWNDAIFRDKHSVHAALSLYIDQQVSAHQFFTLLDFYQTQLDHSFIKAYPLLNDQDELSDEARRYLLPCLNKSDHFAKIKDANEKRFCALVAALPKSEQFFSINNQTGEKRLGDLGGQLAVQGSIYQRESTILILSTGAEDALGIVRFGVEHHAMARSRLGIQTLADIEEATDNGFRPAATYFPGTRPFKADKPLHGHSSVSYYIARRHDVYHANILSKTPLAIRSALSQLKNAIRKLLGNDKAQSSEIWCYTDHESTTIRHEYYANLDEMKFSPERLTQLLGGILKETSIHPENFYSSGAYFIMADKSLSAPGAALFIDMMRHRDRWPAEIVPEKLPAPFAEYYQAIKENWEAIKDDNFNLMVLNCQIYGALKSMGHEAQLTFVTQLIKRHKEYFSIQFEKLDSNDQTVLKRAKNSICTVVNNQKMTAQSHFVALLENFLASDQCRAQWNKRLADSKISSNWCGWFRRKCKIQGTPFYQQDRPIPQAVTLDVSDTLESKNTLFAKRPSAPMSTSARVVPVELSSGSSIHLTLVA